MIWYIIAALMFVAAFAVFFVIYNLSAMPWYQGE